MSAPGGTFRMNKWSHRSKAVAFFLQKTMQKLYPEKI